MSFASLITIQRNKCTGLNFDTEPIVAFYQGIPGYWDVFLKSPKGAERD